MVALGPLQIGYTQGLYALLALIPFILLYLIRPKPPVLKIPSLSFFIKSSFKSPMTSFLRRILQDILVLLQFLAILLLALSVAKPFVVVNHEVTGQNTVIVLDVSGSMQVGEGTSTRFAKAKEKAIESIGKRNTLIVAKEAPSVLLQDASSGETREIIEGLEPTASGSRIGDAILLAGEVLAGKEGHIIVVSDLLQTSGMDPELAKGVVETKGLVVDFISVRDTDKTNVGFVDVSAGELTTQISIKNYEEQPKTVTLEANGRQTTLTIPAQSSETFSFETPPGTSTVRMGANDDFKLDNTFYLSAPTKTRIKVLLVANNRSLFLENALLSSPGVEVTIAEPPIVPKEFFDIFVIDRVKANQVLPGTFETILSHVQERGASAIILAQDDLGERDFKGLLPVTITGKGEAADVRVNQINTLTKNIDFGRMNGYLTATPLPETTQLVTAEGSPIIALQQKGAGQLLYFGLLESASDFRFSPFYPIFWNEAINHLVGRIDMGLLNYKVDETVTFGEPTQIELPDGTTTTTTSLTFDVPGIYTVPGRVLAVNMLNERESNLKGRETEQKSLAYELRTVVEKRPVHLEVYAILIALVLLVGELLIVKWRGEV